jgi:hypothetical protein
MNEIYAMRGMSEQLCRNSVHTDTHNAELLILLDVSFSELQAELCTRWMETRSLFSTLCAPADESKARVLQQPVLYFKQN